AQEPLSRPKSRLSRSLALWHLHHSAHVEGPGPAGKLPAFVFTRHRAFNVGHVSFPGRTDRTAMNQASSEEKRRSVRSYVRRTGRVTRAQENALERLWPRFGLEYSPIPLDLGEVFGREADRVLEI